MKNKSKILPHNIEAEQSILGGILLDKDVINKVAEVIQPDDFYLDSHKKIYQAILEICDRNEPLDLITLTDFFLKKGILEQVGGASYLSKLIDNIPSSANIIHHAKIVKEKSILRKLINVTGDIYNNSFEPIADVEEYLDEAEEKIFEITQKERSSQNWYELKDVLKGTFKIIENLFNKKELITGVPTGFHDLDELTAGLQPSDLIIIAGRPGMGKTSFALSILKNAATMSNVPAAFFSLEMSKEQIVMRLLCAEANIPLQNLRRGFLQQREWTPLINASSKLSKTGIIIDDTPALSILELRSRARRLKAEKNIGLIMIDYLQLMRAHNNKESREQEISEISRSLKALAKELNVPVVALSQLNRAVESKEDKRPQISHLRESGAIEQDADVIMFIYREEFYRRDKENIPDDIKNVAEIIVAKQRNGPTDTVKLYFDSKLTLFGELNKERY
ncbi:MAG: replicative DNA helicase [bacterium]